MKITQTWTRNTPSSAGGYSITVSTTYSSSNPFDIDEIEKQLPKGMIIMDTEKLKRTDPLSDTHEYIEGRGPIDTDWILAHDLRTKNMTINRKGDDL